MLVHFIDILQNNDVKLKYNFLHSYLNTVTQLRQHSPPSKEVVVSGLKLQNPPIVQLQDTRPKI
jgi:hypothetical protein